MSSEAKRTYDRARYHANLEETKAKQRAYRQSIKRAVFSLLGDTCARCGYADLRALQLDHIVPMWKTGGRDRSADSLREWRRALIEPDVFQILCANCHMIKTFTEDTNAEGP